MAQQMPATKFLEGPFAPIRMECEANDLLVEGEIPADLSGSFYRAGPNQRYAPRGDYHLFGGDGMVHAFHIKNGKVDYRNRWVRTAKFNIESKQERNVINPMNPFDCDPDYTDFVFTDKEGLANTAVVWHGGRLLIMEEGHYPYEIDPVTLESIGSWNFNGKLNTAMTAHPKIDPKTGEMLFFAYMATGAFKADMGVYKVNSKGIMTESHIIETPYSAMIHDFVVTENYIIIPVFPLTGSLDRAMAGGPPFAWEADKPVKVGVLKRNGGTAENIRWIDCDLCFIFHFMNGYDKDGVITLHASQFTQAPLFPTPDGKETPQVHPNLHRWTIDLNDPNCRVSFTSIDEHKSEFPQCDPRVAMHEYRYGYYISPDYDVVAEQDNPDAFYNTLRRIDHKTGAIESWSFGKQFTSEILFVPKAGSTEEGVGYLLAVVTNMQEKASSLHIFDATKVAAGPVAVARLQHRIPVGFHGNWRSA